MNAPALNSAFIDIPEHWDRRGLPAWSYHSDELLKLEITEIFHRHWQIAGHISDLAENGDYFTLDIANERALIVRGQDGIVRAFNNLCRHRGARVVADEKGHCKNAIVCPFHGWRWNTEGENTFVFGKQVFNPELLDKAEINLVPCRVEFWAGCAFINFDDDAPSLLDSLGPVAERMNARHADKLKMDWWFGTVLPTNWKLAMEAFQEGYHTMKTHPQLHRLSALGNSYGNDADGLAPNRGLNGKQTLNMHIDFMARLSSGMGGMVHESEVAVMERMRDMEVPDDPMGATMAFYGKMYEEVTKDALARGVPMFDISKVSQEVEFHAVEFMFPHFFLLPMVGAMSSYRIRPLTPETCLFEIWSLVLRPEGEEYDTPKGPTILPYDSPDFPEIPRQDYYNLPLQQLGLHAGGFKHMRLSKDTEGMISNYQRLLDGYLAALDLDTLTKAQNIVNCGFETPIQDIGF